MPRRAMRTPNAVPRAEPRAWRADRPRVSETHAEPGTAGRSVKGAGLLRLRPRSSSGAQAIADVPRGSGAAASRGRWSALKEAAGHLCRRGLVRRRDQPAREAFAANGRRKDHSVGAGGAQREWGARGDSGRALETVRGRWAPVPALLVVGSWVARGRAWRVVDRPRWGCRPVSGGTRRRGSSRWARAVPPTGLWRGRGREARRPASVRRSPGPGPPGPRWWCGASGGRSGGRGR